MTAFISGHLDLTIQEFNQNYIPAIDAALLSGCSFVLGDAMGCDSIAQTYLLNKITDYKTDRVTVYHMFDKPRNSLFHHHCGGFTTDEDRDAAMTHISDFDIAWFRSEQAQKEIYGNKYRKRTSGTERNILRRQNIQTLLHNKNLSNSPVQDLW